MQLDKPTRPPGGGLVVQQTGEGPWHSAPPPLQPLHLLQPLPLQQQPLSLQKGTVVPEPCSEMNKDDLGGLSLASSHTRSRLRAVPPSLHPPSPWHTGKGHEDVIKEEDSQGTRDAGDQKDLEHLQDASPLVGASPGMNGSSCLSIPNLTSSSKVEEGSQEVELQQQKASPPEEDVMELSSAEEEDIADDRLEGTGNMISRPEQEATPLAGGSQEGETAEPGQAEDLRQQIASPPEEEIMELISAEDQDRADDQLEEAGNVISRHEQDAPPLAGASQGTHSSITSSPPDLTVISEKEPPQQISSTPEEETAEPDQPEDLDQRTQKNPTVADDLPEEMWSQSACRMLPP